MVGYRPAVHEWDRVNLYMLANWGLKFVLKPWQPTSTIKTFADETRNLRRSWSSVIAAAFRKSWSASM